MNNASNNVQVLSCWGDNCNFWQKSMYNTLLSKNFAKKGVRAMNTKDIYNLLNESALLLGVIYWKSQEHLNGDIHFVWYIPFSSFSSLYFYILTGYYFLMIQCNHVVMSSHPLFSICGTTSLHNRNVAFTLVSNIWNKFQH